MAAAGETGVPLAVFHNRRWDGDFLAVRDLADRDRPGRAARGALGALAARRWTATAGASRMTDADGGGLLWDLGSHLIDQALVLFGPPSR